MTTTDTIERDRRIMSRYRQGHSQRQIAREVGCAVSTVQHVIGIGRRSTPGDFALVAKSRQPKADRDGMWEQALARIAASGMPPEPPPRPTGSRLRQRRWDALYDPGSRQRGLNDTESDERG